MLNLDYVFPKSSTHRRFTPLDTYYVTGKLYCVSLLLGKLPIPQDLLSNGGTAESAKIFSERYDSDLGMCIKNLLNLKIFSDLG